MGCQAFAGRGKSHPADAAARQPLGEAASDLLFKTWKTGETPAGGAAGAAGECAHDGGGVAHGYGDPRRVAETGERAGLPSSAAPARAAGSRGGGGVNTMSAAVRMP